MMESVMVDLLKNCICYCLSNPVFFFKTNMHSLFAGLHFCKKACIFRLIQDADKYTNI